MMTAKELAETIARLMATRMQKESVLTTPCPQWLLSDPYALLNLFEVEGIATDREIDAWLVDERRKQDVSQPGDAMSFEDYTARIRSTSCARSKP